MPTIDQAKTALSQYLFQHSQDPNAPDFSLVTGLAIAARNPQTALPPEPGLPIKIAVPTETAFPPKIPAPTETVGPLKIPVPTETIAPIAASVAAEQIVVFVEDAPDCVLAPVEAALTAQAQGFPLLFLPTGRFEGLVAAGKSISCCAPAKFNLPELSAGTMGAVVKTPANNYALSSNHVLGFNGRASGVPVCRPGTLDEPNQPNVVGSVSTVVPMLPAAWPMWTPSTVNSVDAALALLTSPFPGTPVAIHQGALTYGAPLAKNGRTTGPTTSRAWCRAWEGYVDLSYGTYYFSGLFGDLNPTAFAAPGDSGALATSNNQAVGLVTARAYSPGFRGLFAGYVVLMCDMQTCLNALAAQLDAPPAQLTLLD